TTRAELTNRNLARPDLSLPNAPRFITPVTTNAALVVWRAEAVTALEAYRYPYREVWSETRETLRTNQAALASIRQAALGGEVRFEPIGHPRPQALLPYLAELPILVKSFGMQTLLALHERRKEEAWTNLLVTTCLVTSYHPEPIDVSHLVRMACAVVAGDITWNALQAGDWTDVQLAELQRRWEAADFLSGMPETAA